jgi:dipeptidase
MRAGARYPGAYAVGDPDHIDLASAWWTFRLVATAVDTDYARKMTDVQTSLLPLERRALAMEGSLEQAVEGMESPAAAALLASYGAGLGGEVLTVCRELLRQWQTKL